MSLCNKESPCDTCKFLPRLMAQCCYEKAPFSEVDITKQQLFGCSLWELREDLLEEQTRRNQLNSQLDEAINNPQDTGDFDDFDSYGANWTGEE